MALVAKSTLIYPAARSFVDRCLVHDLSLLWPDESVWTIANISTIKETFIVGTLHGGESFATKLHEQFDSKPASCWKLLSDALYLYLLPSTFIKNKAQFLRDLIGDGPGLFPSPDDPVWRPLTQGFSRTAYRYHLKYPQLRLIFLFAKLVKTVPNRERFMADPPSVEEALDRLLSETHPKADRASDMRHALLHMIFPDEYERIISTKDKRSIIATYSDHVPTTLKAANHDAQLRGIRSHFQSLPAHRAHFDFYRLQDEWRPRTPGTKRPTKPIPTARTSWIFQANPDFYNLRESLRALAEQTWLVRQHSKTIQPGDRVYF